MRPQTVLDARRYDESQSRREKCRQVIALREALEKDRLARFSVSLDVAGLSPRLKEAIERAFEKSTMAGVLEKLTNKPATIQVTPGAFVIAIRFHPDRYAKAVATLPAHVLDQRAVYFDFWFPAMKALTDLREAAADKLPPYDAPLLREFNTALRLTKVIDDHLELDFGDLEDRLLLADHVRVKVGAHPEATVHTPAPALVREHVFVLGPSQDVGGELTNYGLLYKFFELEEP
jgi:hypothetical protein